MPNWFDWVTKSLDSTGVGIGGAVENGRDAARLIITNMFLTEIAHRNFSNNFFPICGLWAGIDGTTVEHLHFIILFQLPTLLRHLLQNMSLLHFHLYSH